MEIAHVEIPTSNCLFYRGNLDASQPPGCDSFGNHLVTTFVDQPIDPFYNWAADMTSLQVYIRAGPTDLLARLAI